MSFFRYLILNKKIFFGSTAADVYERIKYVVNANTSKEMAERLSISESGISSAIKRNSIPYALCAELALANDVPLDWLIFGDSDNARGLGRIQVQKEFIERTYGQSSLGNKDRRTIDAITEPLNADEAMLLAGWQRLPFIEQQMLFNMILRIVNGEKFEIQGL